MPFNSNLNIKLSAAEMAAIDAALNTIVGTIGTAITDTLNLSDKERRSARTVSNAREPFAVRAIEQFGVAFPDMGSREVSLGKATNNMQLFKQMAYIDNRLKEISDRVLDLKINAGVIAMRFTDDQYRNARDYRNRNIAGADVIYDAQFPLYNHENQSEEQPAAGGSS